MTRASLGHTGRVLTATWPIALIYAAALTAAAARIVAAFEIARTPMLQTSAAAWVIAFGGSVAIYWPVLTGPRKSGRLSCTRRFQANFATPLQAASGSYKNINYSASCSLINVSSDQV
jgi:hypothetical protein